MAKLVLGWLVPREDRKALLARIPPRYANTVADHVTLRSDVPEDAPLPPEREGAVLGVADDGAGVQALVVEIGGTTDRPDGSTYHITWSLAEGRKAVESNDVIRQHGWTAVERHPIRLEPRVFPSRN